MSEPTREQLLAEVKWLRAEVKWLRGAIRSATRSLMGAVDGNTEMRKARNIVELTALKLDRAADRSDLGLGAPECTHDWRADPRAPIRVGHPPQHGVACTRCGATEWRTV